MLGKNHGFSQDEGGPGRLIYRCRRKHCAGDFSRPASAPADTLEAAVVETFLRKLDSHRPHGNLEPVLAAAEERLAAAEARAYSHPGWRSAYDDYDGAGVAEARSEVLSLWRQMQLADLPSPTQLRRRWRQLSLAEQRRILAGALETVILYRGSEPPEERIRLLFAGAPRDWYPKPGLSRALQQFEPAMAIWPTQSIGPQARRRRKASLSNQLTESRQ